MRRYLIILAVVVAAIGGVVALGFTQELSKGLDLQGGIELVYKAQPAPGQEVTGSDLDQAVEIIRDRIDKFGVREPVVTKQGSDQIAVQLAGEFDQARAARLVGKTAERHHFRPHRHEKPRISKQIQRRRKQLGIAIEIQKLPRDQHKLTRHVGAVPLSN